jgi:hypothetical protein
MDQAQRNSRIVHPKLAAPLMDEDLRLLFTIQSGCRQDSESYVRQAQTSF